MTDSRLIGVCILIASLSGCAKYEYELAQPPELARHIGKTDQVFTRDPLEYRLNTVDNRLVMRIFNRTSDAIQLLGDKSSAVDPRGQSHPLRAQMIAPNAYAKLIFPPPRPRIENVGPTFGVGLGMHVRRVDHHDVLVDDRAIYDEPRYFDVYDDNDSAYWDWSGETDVRVLLTFVRGDQNFHHEFTFHRVKM